MPQGPAGDVMVFYVIITWCLAGGGGCVGELLPEPQSSFMQAQAAIAEQISRPRADERVYAGATFTTTLTPEQIERLPKALPGEPT